MPARKISILVQTFVENMQVAPTPYPRDNKLPLVQSNAFDMADDLRLRPTLKSERIAFYHNQGKDPRKGQFRDIDSLCCVIEATTVSMSFLRSPEVRNTVQRTRVVWWALSLYFARIFKVREWISTPGKFIKLGSNPEWTKYIPPIWTHDLPDLEKFDRPITYDQLEKFRQWWQKFESLDPKPTFLLRALDRFGFATSMYGELKDVHQFVDYVSALEALLGESSEAQFKLSLRMAALLGGSDDGHQNVVDFMKEAYDIRSRLVHGGSSHKTVVRKTQINSIETLGRLHEYSRRCIWRVITLLVLLKEAPESKTKKFWLQLNSDNLRKRISMLLDYCLIRDDMRENLMGVLSSGNDPTNLLKQYDQAVGRPYHTSMLDEKNQKARSGISMERY